MKQCELFVAKMSVFSPPFPPFPPPPLTGARALVLIFPLT
jgi:hypothetical protein